MSPLLRRSIVCHFIFNIVLVLQIQVTSVSIGRSVSLTVSQLVSLILLIVSTFQIIFILRGHHCLVGYLLRNSLVDFLPALLLAVWTLAHLWQRNALHVGWYSLVMATTLSCWLLGVSWIYGTEVYNARWRSWWSYWMMETLVIDIGVKVCYLSWGGVKLLWCQFGYPRRATVQSGLWLASFMATNLKALCQDTLYIG